MKIYISNGHRSIGPYKTMVDQIPDSTDMEKFQKFKNQQLDYEALRSVLMDIETATLDNWRIGGIYGIYGFIENTVDKTLTEMLKNDSFPKMANYTINWTL